jgi:chaperonin GroEL (HSP60 family)
MQWLSCAGFLLNKKPGVRQPQRIENAKILIANTPMDTDKIKVFGSRVKVDSVAKVAELELAEKEKMKEKVRAWSTIRNEKNKIVFFENTAM